MVDVMRSLENALNQTPDVDSDVSEFVAGPDVKPKKKKAPQKKTRKTTGQNRVEIKKKSEDVSLIPFSTRLPNDLVIRLNIAIAKRKGRKKSPYTQQAVIESAIESWLKQNS